MTKIFQKYLLLHGVENVCSKISFLLFYSFSSFLNSFVRRTRKKIKLNETNKSTDVVMYQQQAHFNEKQYTKPLHGVHAHCFNINFRKTMEFMFTTTAVVIMSELECFSSRNRD